MERPQPPRGADSMSMSEPMRRQAITSPGRGGQTAEKCKNPHIVYTDECSLSQSRRPTQARRRAGAPQINQLFGRDVELDIRFQAALPFDPSGSSNPSIKALFGGGVKAAWQIPPKKQLLSHMLKPPLSSVKTTDCHFVNRGSPFLRSDQFQNKVLSDSLTPGGAPEALAFFFFFHSPHVNGKQVPRDGCTYN